MALDGDDYYGEPVLDGGEDTKRQAIQGTLVAITVKGGILNRTDKDPCLDYQGTSGILSITVKLDV